MQTELDTLGLLSEEDRSLGEFVCGFEKTIDHVEKLYQAFPGPGGNYLSAASTGN